MDVIFLKILSFLGFFNITSSLCPPNSLTFSCTFVCFSFPYHSQIVGTRFFPQIYHSCVIHAFTELFPFTWMFESDLLVDGLQTQVMAEIILSVLQCLVTNSDVILVTQAWGVQFSSPSKMILSSKFTAVVSLFYK